MRMIKALSQLELFTRAPQAPVGKEEGRTQRVGGDRVQKGRLK